MIRVCRERGWMDRGLSDASRMELSLSKTGRQIFARFRVGSANVRTRFSSGRAHAQHARWLHGYLRKRDLAPAIQFPPLRPKA